MKTTIFINIFLSYAKTTLLPAINLQWALLNFSQPQYSLWYLVVICLIWIFIVLWWRYRHAVFAPGALISPNSSSSTSPNIDLSPFYPTSTESGNDQTTQPGTVSKLYQELEMANQDIEIFLYKAYHNFLGPIATIRGICNVAVLDGQEENSDQYFNQVNRVTESMQAMLEKLLEVSEIHNHRTSLDQLNLSNFLMNYQDSQLRQPESVQARFQLNIPSATQVYADPFLLTTAIEKIITNAYRFSRKKPYQTVDVFVKQQDTSDFNIVRLKQYGLLLPADTLDNLFKMFYRSSNEPDDHGLGFYAARYALRRMGGDIAIESGAGYITFCLKLPKEHIHFQTNSSRNSE